MTFVSYAQNFEDVILSRVFKEVEKGFYIDVGAYDPQKDSVTKNFYDSGWHGINIEPVEANYQKFMESRPNDINIKCLALNKTEEEVNFYEIPNSSGLSTIDEKTALEHSSDLGKESYLQKIASRTLDDILREHPYKDIHFLKVDVEGAERQVLEGIDFSLHRPWVLLVEATKPMSQEKTVSSFEDLILQNGYKEAYFDGLNMFYLCESKLSLLEYFDAPPNVFDNFITENHLKSLMHAKKLEDEIALMLSDAALETQVLQLKSVISDLRMDIEKIHSSISWRLTKPLRLTKSCYLRLKFKTKHAVRNVFRGFLMKALSLSLFYPWIYRFLIRILNFFPPVKRRLSAIINDDPSPLDGFDTSKNINSFKTSFKLNYRAKEFYDKIVN